MIERIFQGAIFHILPEETEEFDSLAQKIVASEDGSLLQCSLWVKFYLKFDKSFIGEI